MYPRPEFGLSDRERLIFRVHRNAQLVDRWRVATDADKDAWPTAYKQLIARAHAAGLKIYGCTLTPAHFTGGLEQLRQDVNSWIRSSGQFDAVIDFDAAIRDPSHPNEIRPGYRVSVFIEMASNPLRYPSALGYQAMANGVPLSLFSDE